MKVAILQGGRWYGRTYSGPIEHVPLRPGESWVEWAPDLVAEVKPEAVPTWETIRAIRDRKLASTDWIVIRAQERGEAVPEAWLTYRRALRDITEQSDPAAIEWPVEP